MKRLFIFIPVQGEAKMIDATDKDNATLLHELVEGWYQCVDLAPDLSMWMNEEGKLHGMEHNLRAQLIWDSAFGAGTDVVMGPVVLTGGVDDEGDTLGLGDAAITRLIALIVTTMEGMVDGE